jgi:hypothetical protein
MSVAELAEISTRLSIGEPQAFRNLTVVPLLDPQAPSSGFLVLDEALAGGVTEVTEISESGSVPQLRLLNRGDEDVFLLDGEELAGAKQNRILNLSILVPGRSELEIPVSCVEQGRWSWRGRGFSGTERVIYSRLRRRNSEAVSASLHSFHSRRGDQGQVWDDIAMKSDRMSVHSDTGAAGALYERHRADLDEFVAGISASSGQVGAAFLVDGRFAGLDLLVGPDLFARLLPKLVRSYALDAIDETEPALQAGNGSARGVDAVRVALRAVPEMSEKRHRAVGRGHDLRLEGDGLVGGALIAEGALIHLGLWSTAYA